MTTNLRKIHRYLWIIIALMLVPLMSLAVVNIPSFPFDIQLINEHQIPEKFLIKEFDQQHLKINLRGAEENQIQQIEIIIKTPLKSANASVYTWNQKENQKGSFLGELGSRGIYRFPISSSAKGIIIEDEIKKNIVQKISF